MAKTYLALPHPIPPNAVFVVWPKKGFGPTSHGPVLPKYGMPGGGYEYIFGFGSGGIGSVYGPIPIPEGSKP
jgi:hypothetical protein